MDSTILNNLSEELVTESTTKATTIPPVPAWATNIVLCYLTIILILGVPGNALLLLAQYRNRNKSTTDYLVATMATFELICSSGVTTMNFLRFNPHLWRYIASDFTCKLNMFMSFYNAMSSNILLVAIATDRYMKTCLPHHNIYSIRVTKYLCIVISVVSVMFGIPGLMSFTVDATLDCVSLMKHEDFVGVYRILLAILTICGVIALCVIYVKISLTLRKRQKRRQTETKHVQTNISGTSTRFLRKVLAWRRSNRQVLPGNKTGDNANLADIKESTLSIASPVTSDVLPNSMKKLQCNSNTSTLAASSDISTISTSLETTDVDQRPQTARTCDDIASEQSSAPQTFSMHDPNIATQTLASRINRGSQRDRIIVNKTTKITLLITLIYAASYILGWLFVFIGKPGFWKVGEIFSVSIHLVNCVSNPILFFTMISKFQRMWKEIFCRG